MTTWLSFLLLLLSIIRAERVADAPRLRLFFRAQLLYTLTLFLGYQMFGNHAELYRAVYVAADLPVFVMAAVLVAEARLSLRMYLAAIVFGLSVTCIGIAFAERFSQDNWICILEGMYLSTIGMSLLLAERRLLGPLTTIGTLYLALSFFDFGYVRNDWESANGWVPSLLCIAAFGWIGVSSPRRPIRG